VKLRKSNYLIVWYGKITLLATESLATIVAGVKPRYCFQVQIAQPCSRKRLGNFRDVGRANKTAGFCTLVDDYSTRSKQRDGRNIQQVEVVLLTIIEDWGISISYSKEARCFKHWIIVQRLLLTKRNQNINWIRRLNLYSCSYKY